MYFTLTILLGCVSCLRACVFGLSFAVVHAGCLLVRKQEAKIKRVGGEWKRRYESVRVCNHDVCFEGVFDHARIKHMFN